MTAEPAARATLFIDCSQRESVLALAPSTGGAHVPFVRRFDAQAEANADAGGGERFWLELADLFREAGVGAEALAAVAVATGPGGFTGLRVSIASGKAIAYARGIPAVGIPSAELFAASDRARGGDGPWLVALASKAGSAWVSLVECMQAADAALDFSPEAGLIVTEELFAWHAAEVARRGGVLLADAHLDPALAACAARVGIPMRGLAIEVGAAFGRAHRASVRVVRTGGAGAASCGSPFSLEPLYAREPEAVTNWRVRRADRGA